MFSAVPKRGVCTQLLRAHQQPHSIALGPVLYAVAQSVVRCENHRQLQQLPGGRAGVVTSGKPLFYGGPFKAGGSTRLTSVTRQRSAQASSPRREREKPQKQETHVWPVLNNTGSRSTA